MTTFNSILTSAISGLTIHNFARRFSRDNIPPHQRNYVWTSKEENKFIDSIMTLPVFGAGVLVFQESDGTLWIEDGQNRLMCIKKFMNDEFSWTAGDGTVRKWSDFTNDEKTHFVNVQFPINQYAHATLSERIEIFTRHQGGRDVVPGEIYHAFMITSPIVILAVRWFFDPTHALHDRLSSIWGDHAVDEHKRFKTLEIVVALAACVLTGNTNALSRKYSDIQPFLSVAWTDAEVAVAEARINRLVSIYEAASALEPMPVGGDGTQLKKKQWDVGTFTGYMLHAILENGLVVPDFDARMAQKLAEHRRRRNAYARNKDKSVLTQTFHHGISSARSWVPARWEHGLRYVFAPEMDRPDLPNDSDESDAE